MRRALWQQLLDWRWRGSLHVKAAVQSSVYSRDFGACCSYFRATASPGQLVQSSVAACSEPCLEQGLQCLKFCPSSYHQPVHWAGAALPDTDTAAANMRTEHGKTQVKTHMTCTLLDVAKFCLDDETELVICVFFTQRQIAILNSRPIC